MDTFIINNENDFYKIRGFKNNEKTFKIIINSDITFNRKFIPIDGFNEYTIYIDGQNHILNNIDIYDPNEKVGMFTKLSNLVVENLNIINSSLYGGVLSGIICGDVEHNTTINNVNLMNVTVSSEAYGGGVVGFSEKLDINNSKLYTEVHGYDVVGGVAGMINHYTEENCDIKSTIFGFGKAIGNDIGYCEDKKINQKKKGKSLFKRFHF